MERLSALFRVLANLHRIQMLRVLGNRGELRASDVVRAVGLGFNAGSVHLRRLAHVGLIRRRRSGACVYYRLTLAGPQARNRRLLAWLRDVLKLPPSLSVSLSLAELARAGGQGRSTPVGVPSDRDMFAWFTAFTHPRRLQLVRLIHESQGKAVRIVGLTRRLSMSPPALSRHVDKLVRRGVVRRAIRRPRGGQARKATLELIERPGNPWLRRLCAYVLEELDGRQD